MAYPFARTNPQDIFEEPQDFGPAFDPVGFGGTGFTPAIAGLGMGPPMPRAGLSAGMPMSTYGPTLPGLTSTAGPSMQVPFGRDPDLYGSMDPMGVDDDPYGDPDPFGDGGMEALRARYPDGRMDMTEALQYLDINMSPPSYASLPAYRDVSAEPPEWSPRRSRLRRMLSSMVPQGRSQPMQMGFTGGRENRPRFAQGGADRSLRRNWSFDMAGRGRSSRDAFVEDAMDPWGDGMAYAQEAAASPGMMRNERRRRRPRRRRSIF